MARTDPVLSLSLTTRPGARVIDPRAWTSIGAIGLLTAVSVAAGHFVANGSVRLVSLLVLLLAAPLAARLSPSAFLALLIVLLPLPLYMQGLGHSITPVLIVWAWISYIASRTRVEIHQTAPGGPLRHYLLPIGVIVLTALLVVGRVDQNRTGADLAALGNLALAVSLFALCLLVFRTRDDVGRAFRAVGLAGAVVLGVTAVQLLAPGLALPGMVASVATVQSNELLPQANLRVGGPLGDYELLAELASLVGIVAFFFCLRTAGARSAAWLGLLLACLVGIGTTSTRSGFVTAILGVLVVALFLLRNRGKILVALTAAAGLGALSIPFLHALQSRFGTGFLLERLLATPTDQGFVHMLDRTSVWPYFTERLGGGPDLFFGRGVAFDLDSWGTYPHSLPLALVATVGITGAAAFFALLALIGWRCLSAWRRTRDPYPALGLVLVAMFALHELKIEYLRVTSYMWFVWALLGICAASAAAARREES